MSDPAVQTIRKFNRRVTQRIGALSDRYLARQRSLGASRVLWEVGLDGTDVRRLRARLQLDSGYLSRLLRSLAGEQLIELAAADRDRRVRTVHLTERGMAEWRILDRKSDELAASLLSTLNPRQQARLVEALSVAERLLTGGLVDVRPEDPTTAAARSCLSAYFRELEGRFDGGFDPQRSIAVDAADLVPPAGVLLVARLHDDPIGCGAVRFTSPTCAEIKRMWVAASSRGLGVGRRILLELETVARDRGARRVRLETNRHLTEAIGLYRSHGFEEVAPFNDEAYADYWFEKEL